MTRAARLLRALRAERGGATVEFVLMFPLFMTVFMSSFEASMLLVRQLVLERALDVVIREVRLSTDRTFPPAVLRRSICDGAPVLTRCLETLSIEIVRIDRATYAIPAATAVCVDTNTAAVPAPVLGHRAADDLMLVRACLSVDLFFPTSAYGLQLVEGGGDGTYRIAAASAFVQEPGT